MARKSTKPPRRTTPVTQEAWDGELYWPVFRRIPDDWTPPRKVRASHQARGYTLDAKFVTPEGETVATRVRLRRDRGGKVRIVEEALFFRPFVSSGAKA